MIQSFRSKVAQDIFDGKHSRHARKIPRELHDKVRRLFDQINAATKVETLKVPPGNGLEKLSGDLASFWSLRVNKQWRVIFHWDNGSAFNVDVVDYH